MKATWPLIASSVPGSNIQWEEYVDTDNSVTVFHRRELYIFPSVIIRRQHTISGASVGKAHVVGRLALSARSECAFLPNENTGHVLIRTCFRPRTCFFGLRACLPACLPLRPLSSHLRYNILRFVVVIIVIVIVIVIIPEEKRTKKKEKSKDGIHISREDIYIYIYILVSTTSKLSFI